ncbi:MAG: 3-methyl-2-oxobutanoate dehydrogenase (2-methylpropanoyl-transferring) subunit alpha, partial [Ilumatobacteraceae bacterium]
LRDHLVKVGEWSEAEHADAVAAVDAKVQAAAEQAESFGTLHSDRVSSPGSMFDDVFAAMPPHLRRQREQAGF